MSKTDDTQTKGVDAKKTSFLVFDDDVDSDEGEEQFGIEASTSQTKKQYVVKQKVSGFSDLQAESRDDKSENALPEQRLHSYGAGSKNDNKRGDRRGGRGNYEQRGNRRDGKNNRGRGPRTFDDQDAQKETRKVIEKTDQNEVEEEQKGQEDKIKYENNIGEETQ